MSDFKHHVMMINYYQMVADNLEEKIFKVRYINHKERGMSILERKLRLKKLEIEDEISFHEKMFGKMFDGSDYLTTPSKKDVIEYASLFKGRGNSAEISNLDHDIS